MMTRINPKLLHIPKHRRDAMVSSPLVDLLREQFKFKTVRVVKGDSVRVVRGEYKGVEGKVERVDTKRGTLNIEGVQREKIRGGQVKVAIHASKVLVTNLKLDDKYRSNMIQGTEPRQENAQEKRKKNDDEQIKVSADESKEEKG